MEAVFGHPSRRNEAYDKNAPSLGCFVHTEQHAYPHKHIIHKAGIDTK